MHFDRNASQQMTIPLLHEWYLMHRYKSHRTGHLMHQGMHTVIGANNVYNVFECILMRMRLNK